MDEEQPDEATNQGAVRIWEMLRQADKPMDVSELRNLFTTYSSYNNAIIVASKAYPIWQEGRQLGVMK